MKFGESPPTLALPLFFRKCFTQGSRCHSAWLPSRCRCKKKNSSLPVQSFEKFGIRKPTLFKKHFCITRNKNDTKTIVTFCKKSSIFARLKHLEGQIEPKRRVELPSTCQEQLEHERIKWTSNPIMHLICASAHGEERKSRYLSPSPQSLTD